MIVGPAVATMVTSMKPRRSPVNRPARIKATVFLCSGGLAFLLTGAGEEEGPDIA